MLTGANGTVLDTRLIVGGDGPPQSSTETFVNLVPGTVTLTATAYPLIDGTGIAQATGAVSAVIQVVLTATPRDAQNNVVLTFGSNFTWTAANAARATLQSTGGQSVGVNGVEAGSAASGPGRS